MTLSGETVIQECTDPSQIPQIKYEFVKIEDLAAKEPGSFVDVIAIVKETGDITNLTSKAGRDLTKREITLIDQSNAAITLTLWGEEAKNFEGFDQPVLLVKGAKIGEYNGGKTLGTAAGSSIKLNPDVEEGHRLRGWFDNGGSSAEMKLLSTRGQSNYSTEWVNFHEGKLRNLGAGDKPDYFQVKGFIHNIRSQTTFYKACSAPDCNKKVVDQDNGNYRCDKCNIEGPSFRYRLLLNVSS
jgi:replication factor A1